MWGGYSTLGFFNWNLCFFSARFLLRHFDSSSDVTMPANANVFIRYGPYKAVGVVQHRDSRLRGLQGYSHI